MLRLQMGLRFHLFIALAVSCHGLPKTTEDVVPEVIAAPPPSNSPRASASNPHSPISIEFSLGHRHHRAPLIGEANSLSRSRRVVSYAIPKAFPSQLFHLMSQTPECEWTFFILSIVSFLLLEFAGASTIRNPLTVVNLNHPLYLGR